MLFELLNSVCFKNYCVTLL